MRFAKDFSFRGPSCRLELESAVETGQPIDSLTRRVMARKADAVCDHQE